MVDSQAMPHIGRRPFRPTSVMPAPTAPHSTDFELTHGLAKVFLSSTIEDYAKLRDQVHEAARKTETYCWQSEESTTTHGSVEEYCRNHLASSQGYLLLLGHWYGTVPPGEEFGRSITHLEYEWAIEQWRDAVEQRMAVLMPALGTAIDTQLLQSAERAMEKRGFDPQLRAEHDRALTAFRDQVTGKHKHWRYVARFRDVRELREEVIDACHRFRHGSLLRAAQAAQSKVVPPLAPAMVASAALQPPTIENADFGLLGRTAQVEAMHDALSALKAGPHPALAVLVFGGQYSGHDEFLAHLCARVLGAFRPRQRRNRLATSFADVGALCAWFAQSLELPAGAPSPAALAELCHAALAERPLGLLLDGVRRFPGGLATFHSTFWQPFCEALTRLAADRPHKNRLLLLMTTYSAEPTPWQSLIRDTGLGGDTAGAMLWPLPELQNFTRVQIERWFTHVGVVDDAAQREALAQRLLTGEEGESDSVPAGVLRRLRQELDAGTIPMQERT